MRVFLLSLFDEWCLGLRTLSSVLRHEEHEVALAYLRSISEMHDEAGKGDPEGYHVPPGSVSGADFRALEQLVRDFKPGLIGIGLTSNYTGLAKKITALLRRASNAPIIWGGIDPTANPDIAIESADIVCMGEGEGAMAELAARLAGGKPYADVANLWVRIDGEIRRNPVRPLVENLDHLPLPDFENQGKYYIHGGQAIPGGLPEVSNLHEAYPILAGRGCPFSCTYCCNSMLRSLYGAAGYVRTRSVDHVLGELERARRMNPNLKIIEFHDDVFAVKPGWLEEFAEKYPRRIGLPFSCYTHANLCSRERVGLLKKAGIAFTIMGVQSGSKRFLEEIYQRKTSREDILQTARLLHEAGIPTVIDLITWTPLDTEEDHRQTLELLLDLPSGYILHDINRLSIYRNHPIAKTFLEKGLLNPWEEGRNVTSAAEAPDARFWYAMLSLGEFHELGRETIWALADNQGLRQKPEVLESLCRALQNAKYLPGTRILRANREYQLVAELEQVRAELARYHGSRAVRWFFAMKNLLKHCGENHRSNRK